jgi:hypothetical protein
MMFFEGYIGAPPTVTVCSFICAYAGIDAVAAKASATTAIAVGRIEGFMSFSPVLFAPRERLRMEIRSGSGEDARGRRFSRIRMRELTDA